WLIVGKPPFVSSLAMASFDLRLSFSASSFTVTASESWIDAGTGGRSGFGFDGGGGASIPLTRARRASRSADGVARPGAGGRDAAGAGGVRGGTVPGRGGSKLRAAIGGPPTRGGAPGLGGPGARAEPPGPAARRPPPPPPP